MWFIFIDADVITGPFDTYEDAEQALRRRGEWTIRYHGLPVSEFKDSAFSIITAAPAFS